MKKKKYKKYILLLKFMASPFSSLVHNLSEGVHRIKCIFEHDDKKCETCGRKYKYCDCFLET